MKKLLAVLFSLILLIFSSCRQEDLINIDIFAKRFNKISSADIDAKNIKAFEENKNIVYSFLLYEKYLLTLTAEKSTGRIKGCSVTVKKSDFSEEIFKECCENTIISFQKISKKDAENILEKFNFKETLFSEEGFYFYYFSKNDEAYFFNAESKRLVEEYVTDLKLYE